MNCKPGDLAIIVSAIGSTGLARDVGLASIGLVGKVTCLRPPVNPQNCASPEVWKFERPMVISVRGSLYEIVGCSDFDLRPIRDPGDDATDESKAWLPPVPTRTKEHA